jgi:hypothetical protein
VVEGQRLTQAAPRRVARLDPCPDLDGEVERDYYVRQLWDGKARASIEAMDAKAMSLYAEVYGRMLAHAHARAGDGVALAGYLGRNDTFDRALASFAEAYADQNERDYAVLQNASREGRIVVELGKQLLRVRRARRTLLCS